MTSNLKSVSESASNITGTEGVDGDDESLTSLLAASDDSDEDQIKKTLQSENSTR